MKVSFIFFKNLIKSFSFHWTFFYGIKSARNIFIFIGRYHVSSVGGTTSNMGSKGAQLTTIFLKYKFRQIFQIKPVIKPRVGEVIRLINTRKTLQKCGVSKASWAPSDWLEKAHGLLYLPVVCWRLPQRRPRSWTDFQKAVSESWRQRCQWPVDNNTFVLF